MFIVSIILRAFSLHWVLRCLNSSHYVIIRHSLSLSKPQLIPLSNEMFVPNKWHLTQRPGSIRVIKCNKKSSQRFSTFRKAKQKFIIIHSKTTHFTVHTNENTEFIWNCIRLLLYSANLWVDSLWKLVVGSNNSKRKANDYKCFFWWTKLSSLLTPWREGDM